MGQYFIEQMSNCLNAFYELYNRDEYLSKRKYEKFLDKYKDVFLLLDKCDTKDSELYHKICIIAQNGYNMINNKNQKFIKAHLIKNKEYFDNMFKKLILIYVWIRNKEGQF